jgi:hypothetical protein
VSETDRLDPENIRQSAITLLASGKPLDVVERNSYAWALVEVKRAVRAVNSNTRDLEQLSTAVTAVRRHTRPLRLGAFG